MTERYITPREFCVLIADLRLASTIFQERLLEFLERQRIIAPVARVRWPAALVVEKHDGVPAVPATQQERDAAAALSDALRLWRRFDADPELEHPFDRGEQPGGDLICTDVAGTAFEPWESFRTNIRPEGEEPCYVTDAVDTYYHAYQALLVADALDMGSRVIFDTRRPELMQVALRDIRALPDDVAWHQVSFEGPRGLEQGLRWARYFDAAARVETVHSRKLSAVAQNYSAYPIRLTAADMSGLAATHQRAAAQAVAAIGASATELRAFLTYLCERWDDWRKRGRPEVAAEYKRQIALVARMTMRALEIEFSALAGEIGCVTGHFENTLDVIFPDWAKGAREKAELSLKRAVVAKAPAADANLTLTEADAADTLAWLERVNLWKVHLGIETILARQFSNSRIDNAALAKEVESLSTTFEHVVGALLTEAGVQSTGTLMRKVQRFWSAVSDVHSVLVAEHGLVSTTSITRAAQVASINALSATGPNMEVTRTILLAVLYRNDGQHNSMMTWPEEELHHAIRVFLTAIMLCRKNLLTSPPKP